MVAHSALFVSSPMPSFYDDVANPLRRRRIGVGGLASGPRERMSATDDLQELAREHPEEVRRFAEKADEPIRSRLLRLLKEDQG